jgi:hypothetical protein
MLSHYSFDIFKLLLFKRKYIETNNFFENFEEAIKNGLSRDTGNTLQTRQRTNANKTQNKTQHRKEQISNIDPTKHRR